MSRMPVVGRDADGDPLYGIPEEWSLDRDPGEMTTKELCAAVARDVFGCRPEWNAYYGDWCCSCGQHVADQQCSVVADFVKDARWTRRLARKMEQDGLVAPRMSACGREVCVEALRAYRRIQ